MFFDIFDCHFAEKISRKGGNLIVEIPAMRAKREECSVDVADDVLEVKAPCLGEVRTYRYRLDGRKVASATLAEGVLEITLEPSVSKVKIEIS